MSFARRLIICLCFLEGLIFALCGSALIIAGLQECLAPPEQPQGNYTAMIVGGGLFAWMGYLGLRHSAREFLGGRHQLGALGQECRGGEQEIS